MTDPVQRARYLGEQLSSLMESLAQATKGPDIVLFLDRLARLEAYPAEELTAAGVERLVRDARAAREEHSAELGKLAGWAIDLETLLDVGRHLPSTNLDAGERFTWLNAVLRLATILPWLPPSRQMLARGALERARAQVVGEPAAFLAASALASDRWQLEHPEGLCPEAAAVLALLDEVALLAAVDADSGRADASRVKAALDAAGRHAVEAAEDAIADHEEGPVRLPSGGLRLAAGQESTVSLIHMEGGDWLMTTLASQSWLVCSRAPGSEDEPSVDVVDGPCAGSLSVDAKGRFPLPSGAAGAWLRVRIGPDSRRVRLPPVQG